MVDQNSYLYFFSTSLQILSALIGLLAVVYIYSSQFLEDKKTKSFEWLEKVTKNHASLSDNLIDFYNVDQLRQFYIKEESNFSKKEFFKSAMSTLDYIDFFDNKFREVRKGIKWTYLMSLLSIIILVIIHSIPYSVFSYEVVVMNLCLGTFLTISSLILISRSFWKIIS